MKTEVKCYKCGKRISVYDYATTDICPECMSFIDVAQAKAALEEEEKALSAPVTDQSEQSEKTDAPLTETAAEPKAADLQAEEENWRAPWRKVLQRTKGLTDLSQFDSVRGDAKEAFQKMSASERAQLYKTHGKTLAERRETLVNRIKAADAGCFVHRKRRKGNEEEAYMAVGADPDRRRLFYCLCHIVGNIFYGKCGDGNRFFSCRYRIHHHCERGHRLRL